MASEAQKVTSFVCNSYSTALAVFPPKLLQQELNVLRAVYDKSYPRWAPHITLAFPFVAPEHSLDAYEQARDLLPANELLQPFHITFNTVKHFTHKDSVTVYLEPDDFSVSRLRTIRNKLSEIFNFPSEGDGVFRPHLTIGQTTLDNESINLLKEKAQMLLPISWTIYSLSIIHKNESDGGKMELFASIPQRASISSPPTSCMESIPCCYAYDDVVQRDYMYQPVASLFASPSKLPKQFTVSTYNILHSPLQPQTPESSRLPILLNTVLNLDTTILFLQEVTDVAWRYFLSNRELRKKYRYVSALKHLPLPNTRNIVLLSTIPFEAYYLPLMSPHKPALIAKCGNMTFAGVHLSSGLHEEKLALKLKELSKLTNFLEAQKSPFIMVGDFNIPNQPREYTAALPKIHELLSRYTDAWTEVSNESGNTFVPEQNRFAKEGCTVQYPQRHDRIYLSTPTKVKVSGARLFGIPEKENGLGSDHWGLSVDLGIEIREKKVSDAVKWVYQIDIPEMTWTDEQLVFVLKDVLPAEEDDEKITSALALLSTILQPVTQIPLRLQVVGSCALGAHTKNSDLDVLAISSISQKLFWTIFLQHLKRYKTSEPTNRLRVLRIIQDAKTPMVELMIDGQKVEVQYCPSGRLLPIWHQVASLSSSSDEMLLPAPILKQLNAYRDDMKILSSVRNKDTFRLARRAFKYFCSQRGIYGSKFGFLGGFAVTLLIAGVCCYLPADSSASQIVAAAIKRYAEFPWERAILFFPYAEKGRESREERDAMYVSSIHRPLYNVMKNASKSTLHTIISELKLATEKLSTVSFEDVSQDCLNEFFNKHRTFIKVQCSFWGANSADGRKWISWIESRLVQFLVNLAKQFPQLETRLWPARFGDTTSNDVHGTYLIGVSGSGVDEGAFRAVLRDAERSMKLEGQEVVDRWVSIILCRSKEIKSEKLEIDYRTWEGEEQIIVDEEMEDEEEVKAAATTATNQESPAIASKEGKLRPSHDVFNRLFWDSEYSAEDYVVGYEDRFKGIMELPLTSWKKEFTDEEFIPFHRVVYFRQKGDDGKIVWDRRTRLDLIFGSS